MNKIKNNKRSADGEGVFSGINPVPCRAILFGEDIKIFHVKINC
jgi:hypothetical protein